MTLLTRPTPPSTVYGGEETFGAAKNVVVQNVGLMDRAVCESNMLPETQKITVHAQNILKSVSVNLKSLVRPINACCSKTIAFLHKNTHSSLAPHYTQPLKDRALQVKVIDSRTTTLSITGQRSKQSHMMPSILGLENMKPLTSSDPYPLRRGVVLARPLANIENYRTFKLNDQYYQKRKRFLGKLWRRRLAPTRGQQRALNAIERDNL